jgi:peroxiredoxin (alkyl hydroperoxide reductase subunit C)
MPVEIGQEAPDFVLKDQDGATRRLSDFRGDKHVVVVFYPLAFSGICTAELCQLRDDLPAFENDDVATVAVSVDSPYVLRAFADKQGYRFTLLSDFWPHGATARAYGVFNEERGFANRGTFIVDKQGVIRYLTVHQPAEPRDPEEYRKALAGLA